MVVQTFISNEQILLNWIRDFLVRKDEIQDLEFIDIVRYATEMKNPPYASIYVVSNELKDHDIGHQSNIDIEYKLEYRIEITTTHSMGDIEEQPIFYYAKVIEDTITDNKQVVNTGQLGDVHVIESAIARKQFDTLIDPDQAAVDTVIMTGAVEYVREVPL